MAEDAVRAMHQQFTTALKGLTRQNTELQNESRQQAANWGVADLGPTQWLVVVVFVVFVVVFVFDTC